MDKKISSRRAQAEETRKKLFATAVKLIQRKGYYQTTVSEICKEAGVSKGTFYVHYKSKEDIVRDSYYVNIGEYVLSHFEQWLRDHPRGSLFDRIEKFLLLEFAYASSTGYELICLAYAMNFSSCVPEPGGHMKKRVFAQRLKALVDEGARQGSFDETIAADDIFLYLESAARGVMESWCFSGGSFDLEEKGRMHIKLALKGLRRQGSECR